MREILFRGQTRRYGEKVNLAGEKLPSNWVYGGIFPQNNGGDRAIIYQQEPEIKKIVVYANTVGQYTGLTDENGTKIFEGDVCRDSIGWIFKVIWDNENARFIGCYIKPRGDTYICYVGREPKVEILGNIHDNPELIKECEQE